MIQMDDKGTNGRRRGGETEAVLSEEARIYQEAENELQEALASVKRARTALQQWEADNHGFIPTHPMLVQLKMDVKEAQEGMKTANKVLNDAERQWKEANGVGDRSVKKQKLEASDEWIKDLQEKDVEIPKDIDKLRAFLQQGLRMKIPCSQRLLSWISARDTSKLSDDVTKKLFERFDGETSLVTNALVFNVMDPTTCQSACPTEGSCILFWDTLIAKVLMKVSNGCYLRHSNGSTSTGLYRPDFCFYYKKLDLCVFGGEERAGGQMSVPLAALQDKLERWIYDDAPYLLVYAAVGSQLELAIIQKHERGRVIVQVVEHYDLDSLVDRLQFFLAILNLSTLFRPLVDKVKTRFAGPEFGIFKKENGLEIHFGTVNAMKKYPSEIHTPVVRSVIEHLEHVHSLMASHSVPNVIQLVSSNVTKRTVCLTPIGYLEAPRNLKELVRALLDILDALIHMHRLKIMHRDLRWDNILRYCAGGQKWFIIDFDDSAQLTKSGRAWILRQARDPKDLDRDSHAPEIFNSTHDEKVDIWSIGYLIHTSHRNVSSELHKIKIDCMDANPKKRPTSLVLHRRLKKLLTEHLDS